MIGFRQRFGNGTNGSRWRGYKRMSTGKYIKCVLGLEGRTWYRGTNGEVGKEEGEIENKDGKKIDGI